MPKHPRILMAGQPTHIVSRGVNRCVTFTSSTDFLVYLELLYGQGKRHACDIHAYVLMTNHSHLIVTPHDEKSLPKFMKAVNGPYAQYFNQRRGRTGGLWQGRYFSSLIDSEQYFLSCIRYVERNPVRAGMCALPGDYQWTSFHHNALGCVDPLITPHWLLTELADTDRARRAAYLALFDLPVDEELESAIRFAGRTNRPLGATFLKTRVSPLRRERLAVA